MGACDSTDEELLEYTSEMNMDHMYQTESIRYLTEWIPSSLWKALQMTSKDVEKATPYAKICLLEKIFNDPKLYNHLQSSMVSDIGRLLDAIEKSGGKEGFISADDIPMDEKRLIVEAL